MKFMLSFKSNLNHYDNHQIDTLEYASYTAAPPPIPLSPLEYPSEQTPAHTIRTGSQTNHRQQLNYINYSPSMTIRFSGIFIVFENRKSGWVSVVARWELKYFVVQRTHAVQLYIVCCVDTNIAADGDWKRKTTHHSDSNYICKWTNEVDDWNTPNAIIIKPL